MATTIEIPMELDAVNPTSPNFGWVQQNGPFWYSGRYRFHRIGNPAMPSGECLSTWKINIPKNMASPAAWNIVLHHVNTSANPGAVLVHGMAKSLGSGDSPSAMTVIVPNKIVGVGSSGDLNITDLSGSNFDSLVPLTAGEDLYIQLKRMPLTSSGDTIAGGWDLILPPILRIDVV